MAWRDYVSYTELVQYMGEHIYSLVCHLDINFSDAIEMFLDEHNESFVEFIESELGRKPGEYEQFNIH